MANGTVCKVIIIGNLGRAPEVRHAQDGSKIANLNVATSETWNDRISGDRKEKTEWHRVVIFNDRIIEVAERYLKKGSKVYIEGTLQTRKWTDQSGAEKFTTEVVITKFKGELTILDGRPEEGGHQGQSDYQDYHGEPDPAPQRQASRAPSPSAPPVSQQQRQAAPPPPAPHSAPHQGQKGGFDDDLPF
jgi:single-strand DNA-binding protein